MENGIKMPVLLSKWLYHILNNINLTMCIVCLNAMGLMYNKESHSIDIVTLRVFIHSTALHLSFEKCIAHIYMYTYDFILSLMLEI